jgi:hypothetical protein
VELVGSRSRGDSTALSDWDFVVATDDFAALALDIDSLVSSLEPLAKQWDRLSSHQTFMLIVPGPFKVDLITNQQNEQDPPWNVSAETLPSIDAHFWDWMLWLGSKQLRRQHELVGVELRKLFAHLLGPMGARGIPADITSAISQYQALRNRRELEFDVSIPRTVSDEVLGALQRSGVVLPQDQA